MTKTKVMKVLGIGLAMLLAVLVFTSCAAPAAAPTEREGPPAVIKAVPDTGAPRAKTSYIGANFVPGEKVTVCVLMARGPVELAAECIVSGKNVVVGTPAEKGMVQVNEVGSFHIQKINLPKEEGIWPVTVYDENGNPLASTLVIVKKPEPKK